MASSKASSAGRPLRVLLYALHELEREVDADEVMGHLRDMVAGYHGRREDLMAMARYLAAKRDRICAE